MNACPVCGQLHSPNCLRVALDELKRHPVLQLMPHCPFCGYPRSDSMQTHAPDCEWCTLAQRMARIEQELLRLERIELLLMTKETHGSSEEPTTQRTGGTSGLGVDWAPPVSRDDGLSERSIQSLDFWGNLEADYACRAHSDPSAAEPAHPEADSAVPAGAEPERSG
jgi:hypothetical protein